STPPPWLSTGKHSRPAAPKMIRRMRIICSSCSWVLGSNGTRNRCKPAISFAEFLLSAQVGRLRRNGHMFVRRSLLQKPKLAQQFLQGYGSNLLSCMPLCLNSVFWSVAVPFTNQTRLIFESVLPLLPHRRRIPSPLSQSMCRSPSPRVASRERGQN